MNKKRALRCPNCGANVSPDCVCCSYCKSTLSVTSCPKCFASIFIGMKFCPDCGKAIDRSILAERKTLLCAKCNIFMEHILVGEVPLCECGTCGSLWLDTKTFNDLCEETADQERVLAYDRPMVSDSTNKTGQGKWKYMPCPECGELMNRKNFLGCSGIIIDYCKNHGTWFEHKELQQIVKFIQSGGMLKARKKELDKLKEEQKKLKDMTLHQDINSVLMMESLKQLNKSVQVSQDSDKTNPLYDLLVKFLR